jgi:hypothetical protein
MAIQMPNIGVSFLFVVCISGLFVLLSHSFYLLVGILISWNAVDRCIRNLEFEYIDDPEVLENLNWELESADNRSNKRKDRK